VKHKYNRNYQEISPEDAKYYRPLLVELIARRIKRVWTKLKRTFRTSGNKN
jgi:hypothetical protein